MNAKNTATEVAKKETSVKMITDGKKENPTELQKKSVLDIIEKFKPEPLTADARIQRIEHFEALSKRYKALKDKSNDLKMFDAGNDKVSAKITFENAQGFKFEIRNSNVIGRLIKGAEEELNILLAEANNEVLTFEI